MFNWQFKKKEKKRNTKYFIWKSKLKATWLLSYISRIATSKIMSNDSYCLQTIISKLEFENTRMGFLVLDSSKNLGMPYIYSYANKAYFF